MPRIRKKRTSDETLGKARTLRHRLTPAEKILWRELRDGEFSGFKFRRQVPVGKFIVDFSCPSRKVIVEIDGDSHAEQVQYDANRTRELEKQNYRVIRFTNSDVHRNPDGVLEAILKECERRR